MIHIKWMAVCTEQGLTSKRNVNYNADLLWVAHSNCFCFFFCFVLFSLTVDFQCIVFFFSDALTGYA